MDDANVRAFIPSSISSKVISKLIFLSPGLGLSCTSQRPKLKRGRKSRAEQNLSPDSILVVLLHYVYVWGLETDVVQRDKKKLQNMFATLYWIAFWDLVFVGRSMLGKLYDDAPITQLTTQQDRTSLLTT